MRDKSIPQAQWKTKAAVNFSDPSTKSINIRLGAASAMRTVIDFLSSVKNLYIDERSAELRSLPLLGVVERGESILPPSIKVDSVRKLADHVPIFVTSCPSLDIILHKWADTLNAMLAHRSDQELSQAYVTTHGVVKVPVVTMTSDYAISSTITCATGRPLYFPMHAEVMKVAHAVRQVLTLGKLQPRAALSSAANHIETCTIIAVRQLLYPRRRKSPDDDGDDDMEEQEEEEEDVYTRDLNLFFKNSWIAAPGPMQDIDTSINMKKLPYLWSKGKPAVAFFKYLYPGTSAPPNTVEDRLFFMMQQLFLGLDNHSGSDVKESVRTQFNYAIYGVNPKIAQLHQLDKVNVVLHVFLFLNVLSIHIY